jgi:predicted  nucleic acid-binding Zn-ribbon protein
MAEPYDTLLEVQHHDTALDQLRHRIRTLPERAELQQVRARQAALATATAELQGQVDDLAGRQRSLEEQIATTAKRRHEIEVRMQSGEVSASRDLQAMDHEVHQLVERQSQFEEEELVLLEEEEPLDGLLEEHRQAAAELAAEVGRLQAAIVEAEAGLQSQIADEEVVRAERAADLPADLAERYERLRARLDGVGAAKLVGDRCDGCHLNLSSVELERLRHLRADEFATCPQCDRILVH